MYSQINIRTFFFGFDNSSKFDRVGFRERRIYFVCLKAPIKYFNLGNVLF